MTESKAAPRPLTKGESKQAKHLFHSLMGFFADIGFSKNLKDPKLGAGGQVVLKLIKNGSAKERTFTPKELYQELVDVKDGDDVKLQWFVNAVTSTQEFARRRKRDNGSIMKDLGYSYKDAFKKGSDYQQVARKFIAKHPDMAPRLNRNHEDFIGHRFFFFDLDFPRVDGKPILTYDIMAKRIDEIGLNGYCRAIIETSPGRFHLYFATQHIATHTAKDTVWRVDRDKMGTSEEDDIYTKATPLFNGHHGDEPLFVSASDINKCLMGDDPSKKVQYSSANSWLLPIGEGVGKARKYTTHKVCYTKNPKRHRIGKDFVTRPDVVHNYFHCWHQLNAMFGGDMSAVSGMKEAALPIYPRWSRSEAKWTTPKVHFTNNESKVLTVHQALLLIEKNKNNTTLPDLLREKLEGTGYRYPSIPESFSYPVHLLDYSPKCGSWILQKGLRRVKPKGFFGLGETPPIARAMRTQNCKSKSFELKRHIEKWLVEAANAEMVADAILADADLWDQIAKVTDWVNPEEKKTGPEWEMPPRLGIPDIGSYIRSGQGNRKFKVLEEGKTDYNGQRNELILDLTRYIHYHVNCEDKTAVDNYWNEFVKPFLQTCQSGDLDKKSGINRCYRSFKASVKNSKVFRGGKVINPLKPTPEAIDTKRRNIFKQFLLRLGQEGYGPKKLASLILPIAALSNVMACFADNNTGLSDWQYSAFVPMERLIKVSGCRIYSFVTDLEKFGVLRRSPTYQCKRDKVVFVKRSKISKTNGIVSGITPSFSSVRELRPSTKKLPHGGEISTVASARLWTLSVAFKEQAKPNPGNAPGHIRHAQTDNLLKRARKHIILESNLGLHQHRWEMNNKFTPSPLKCRTTVGGKTLREIEREKELGIYSEHNLPPIEMVLALHDKVGQEMLGPNWKQRLEEIEAMKNDTSMDVDVPLPPLVLPLGANPLDYDAYGELQKPEFKTVGPWHCTLTEEQRAVNRERMLKEMAEARTKLFAETEAISEPFTPEPEGDGVPDWWYKGWHDASEEEDDEREDEPTPPPTPKKRFDIDGALRKIENLAPQVVKARDDENKGSDEMDFQVVVDGVIRGSFPSAPDAFKFSAALMQEGEGSVEVKKVPKGETSTSPLTKDNYIAELGDAEAKRVSTELRLQRLWVNTNAQSSTYSEEEINRFRKLREARLKAVKDTSDEETIKDET